MNLIQSTLGGPQFPFPHTGVVTTMVGAVESPTEVAVTGPVTFIPAIFPKGETNTYIRIKSYAELENRLGLPTEKRTGRVASWIKRWLAAGGNLLTVNMRDTDAGLANLVISLSVTPVSKTLYVAANGVLYSAEPTDGTVTKPITLNTYAFNLIGQNFSGKSNFKEVDLEAKAVKNTASPNSAVIPLYRYSYKGATKHGNNYSMNIQATEDKLIDDDGNEITIFDFLVTDASTDVTSSFKVTHMSDILNGTIPMSLEDVMKTYYKGLDFRKYEEYQSSFDTLFITMLDSLMAQVRTEIDTNTVTELETIYTYMSDLKTTITAGDLDRPMIDYIGIFGQSDITNLNLLFQCPSNTDSLSFSLAGGDDGWVGRTRFDWDYTTTKDSVTIKPFIELYKKAFNLGFGNTMLDPGIFDVSFVPDINYPLSVKQALIAYLRQRFEVPGLSNTPESIMTMDEVKTYRNSFKPGLTTLCNFVGGHDIIDIYEGKTSTITLVENLPELMYELCTNPKSPLSGKFLTNIIDGSVFPEINTTDDLTWCFKNNYNYLTFIPKDGYMIDGQACDIVGKEHSIKELHNAVWAGMILRDVIAVLTKCRHLIKSKALGITNTRVYNDAIKKYELLGIKCEFKAYYKDEYDEATGTVTDYLNIYGEVTTKRNNLIVTYLNE